MLHHIHRVNIFLHRVLDGLGEGVVLREEFAFEIQFAEGAEKDANVRDVIPELLVAEFVLPVEPLVITLHPGGRANIIERYVVHAEAEVGQCLQHW